MRCARVTQQFAAASAPRTPSRVLCPTAQLVENPRSRCRAKIPTGHPPPQATTSSTPTGVSHKLLDGQHLLRALASEALRMGPQHLSLEELSLPPAPEHPGPAQARTPPPSFPQTASSGSGKNTGARRRPRSRALCARRGPPRSPTNTTSSLPRRTRGQAWRRT